MKHVFASRKVAAAGLTLGLILSVAPTFNHAPIAGAAHQRAATGLVGFLITDFTTSARWAFDRDYVIADLKALDPGVKVQWTDAHADQTKQQTEAQSLLTAGAKVLIDVPVDSVGAGQIVKLAHANTPPVPVIAYDRLISNAPVDAYTSFDGFSVGVQQAK